MIHHISPGFNRQSFAWKDATIKSDYHIALFLLNLTLFYSYLERFMISITDSVFLIIEASDVKPSKESPRRQIALGSTFKFTLSFSNFNLQKRKV